MKHYLNENIFIENDIFFYEENKKKIKIKERDWHTYLSDYGWSKLNKKWIMKLNKLSKNKKKNSLFGCLDCGGDGDCLFHCISYAINDYKTTETEKLRNDLAEYITEDKFRYIIEIYSALKDDDDFEETWDPNNVTLDKFKRIVKEGGNNYWGDFLILDLLKEYLDVNIVVLYNNDYKSEYYYYPTLHTYDDDKNTIILLYENDIHFQLIGHFSIDKMNTLFNRSNIPEEILSMVKLR